MKMPRDPRATIGQVAKLAGVSNSSVSRALNGQTTNTEIIRRVQEAAHELGYVPNAIARSMRSQKVGTVGFVVEDISNPAYLAMVRAIQPVLSHAGTRLVLYSTGGDENEELKAVHDLDSRLIDGLIICPIQPSGSLIEALSTVAGSVVMIGGDGLVPFDRVRPDSPSGARLAVEHLIEHGSRRIGFMTGPPGAFPSVTALAGYRSALEEAGLFDSSLIEGAGGFQFAEGQAAMEQLLARSTCDAVIAITDRLALGALKAISEAGLSSPGDVRVVGFDDSELAGIHTPSLTGVNLGAAEIGHQAAELLLSRLADPQLPRREVVVAAAISVRETTS
jgi:LacI family transcriptional regulator